VTGSGGGFEVLEHTADLGIRAWGGSTPEAFEQAARGLSEVMGLHVPGPGTRRVLTLKADDVEGLLVGLLNELLFIHETRSEGFVAVDVIGLSEDNLVAEIEVAPQPDAPDGLMVKAATYHEVAVGRRPDGVVEARVYLDV
jgi:SHS2 domain-containing protein